MRNGLPAFLIAVIARKRTPAAHKAAAALALCGFWGAVWARYRRSGHAQTAHERQLMATASFESYRRHYNERVPTIEEELEIWGAYHRHRHEMRYDLVAKEVLGHLLPGGTVADIGCGSAALADRLQHLDAHYIGIEYGWHQVSFAAKKHDCATSRGPLSTSLVDTEAEMSRSPSKVGRLRTSFVQAGAETLPIRDGSVDVVVMSEVIEHLLRPELAVWEIARVLKPGGVFVMTTNNASEVPLRSPLSHLLPWAEKALGATHPRLISLRPWVWPEPVEQVSIDGTLTEIYVPHTHHIQAETTSLFAAAGLSRIRWSTFEFPPPQSATAKALEARGELGRQAVDMIEAVARRLPMIKRMGCHLMMTARKTGPAVAAQPPQGIWPGPFSCEVAL